MLAHPVMQLHDRLLQSQGWPQVEPAVVPAEPVGQMSAELWKWVQVNHRNNSLLWAEEDLARRTRVADAEIAANKRAIDRYNQARNDATERVDELLLLALGLVDEASARSASPQSRVPSGARLNSETAGSMVDRLSIMALKSKAMHEQTLRPEVDASHREASQAKWARLQEQRRDLGDCLDQLLLETAAGKAYFKVYRQFKMYNDPQLNPQLVKELRQP
jgi:hypothetical protein